MNGRRIDRASYKVKVGDRIGVKPRESSQKMVREQLKDRDPRAVQPWLQVDAERLEGRMVALPGRDHVQIPVEEQLIVELCSR